MERPDWCPHKDCNYKASISNKMCGGKLPEETKDGHGNTHRFCLDTRETGHGIFDLQLHSGDMYCMNLIFKKLKESD